MISLLTRFSRSKLLCRFKHKHLNQRRNLAHNDPKSKSSTDSIKDRRFLRNVGVIAHINAGKTTTTERILYHSGSTQIAGDVDTGNTVTDYLDQERDRGITITSAAVSFNWKKHRVNLIDTPGHVDFTFEVERSLAVLDGAVTILDASAGVEAQTITVWNQAIKYNLPNVIFLNKYDKLKADYRMCMKDLKYSLNIEPFLMQIPIKTDQGNLTTLLDVVNNECISWVDADKNQGSKFSVKPISSCSDLNAKMVDLVIEEREKLVNYLSDIDDKFASHVIDCDKISDVSSSSIRDAIRVATLNCKLSPVLVGSSFKYVGVQQLMDAMINYLPSPIDRRVQIQNLMELKQLADSKYFCAFIFKIMHDKRLGPLTYLRLFNGSMKKLDRLYNLESHKSEQVKKVYRVFADELIELDSNVDSDDIVVVTGLSESRTGDILVAHKEDSADYRSSKGEEEEVHSYRLPFRLLSQKVVVPQISRMEPVYFCSIESNTKMDQVKLESALACLAREDPSFSYDIDEVGITTIRGMGKLHLEIARDRIATEHGVDSILGPLQISYRETINGSANEQLQVNKLINGVKSSLSIKLYVRAKPDAGTWTGKMMRLDTTGDSSLGKLRSDHRRAIENGFLSALANGPSLGYPVHHCDILLLDFQANSRCGLPVISSAASQCLAAALRRCQPVLLEPIMLLEVVSPSEINSTLMGDVAARRGQVVSVSGRSDRSVVLSSFVPLSELADYSEYLRVTTSGRASFSMRLHKYQPMSESQLASLTRL